MIGQLSLLDTFLCSLNGSIYLYSSLPAIYSQILEAQLIPVFYLEELNHGIFDNTKYNSIRRNGTMPYEKEYEYIAAMRKTAPEVEKYKGG